MANTILTAKNTFEEGLIMDFSPDNTLSNCLTSALNATILTNNGNEMALLNDMGNARVETAYLPEGYVPVGTCEFGDIIYVVSYNPIINKSLIGCFPSPERNISSDEIGGMKKKLSWTDFLESTDPNNPSLGLPTGKLKSTSVQKILYGTKNMNPGDKYIIYSEDLANGSAFTRNSIINSTLLTNSDLLTNNPPENTTNANNQYLSDYGSKSHLHNSFPKLVKVHVVSIEESGKIVYLDSTTKWYKDNNYYLSLNLKTDAVSKEDLDTHRARVNSAYSVFASKVSGKLALLVELEKISGFSCSWLPYITGTSLNSYDDTTGTIENTTYKIYWNFNWTTNDNNINPNGAMLTLSEWSGVEKEHEGKYLLWRNDGSKIKLGKESDGDSDGWVVDKLTTPSNYETSIIRQYCPENANIDFDTFRNSYEYNAYLETELIKTKTECGLIKKNEEGVPIKDENGNITVEDVTPYKLNIYKTEKTENSEGGLPDIGKYLINCTNIIVDKDNKKERKYYTTNLDGKLIEISPVSIKDDIVNNYFHYPIIKKFADFSIPTKLIFGTVEKTPNISNLIYHYKIAPTMPYGILEEFEQEGYIDFSKIGTGNIELTSWKYYNYENTSTLTWGMDAYTKPGRGISEVVFEFYDNNGFAAAYHNKGKLSYSGNFTEYITLNESGSNYKLNNIKADGSQRPHKGLEVTKEFIENNPNGIYLKEDGTIVDLDYDGKCYLDDSGTLYSNYLYLVKIIIKDCVKGALDEYIDDSSSYITDYRWYWTNTMFNDYYHSVLDFKELLFTLNLDFNAQYSQKEGTIFSLDVKYEVPNNDTTPTKINDNEYTLLKANVTYVNLDGVADLNGNIECKLLSGLYNDYSMFNLNKDTLSNIETTIYLGKSYIESPDLPKVISTEDLPYVFPGIYPTNEIDSALNNPDNPSGKVDPKKIGKTLIDLLGITTTESGEEINASAEAYNNYKNSFSLKFPNKYNENGNIISTYNDYQYLNYKGEVVKMNADYYTFSDNISIDYKFGNNSADFTFTGILYSKYYEFKKTENIEALRVKPLLYDKTDLETYNLTFVPSYSGSTKGHFYFNKLGGVCVGDDQEDEKVRTKVRYFEGSVDTSDYKIRGFTQIGERKFGKSAPYYLTSEMQETDKGTLSLIFNGITPFVLIKDNMYGRKYSLNDGFNQSNNKVVTVTNLHNYFPSTFRCDLLDGAFTKDLDNLLINNRTDNAFIFLAIKDKENNLHFVNTYIAVKYDTYSKKYIEQKIRYKSGINSNVYKPETIGDAIASLLMNLYYTNGETTAYPSFQSYNFVYLENHDYIFTKDIIFKYKAKEETTKKEMTNMILFHGMLYGDDMIKNTKGYVSLVLDKVEGITASISDPNVSLDLKGMEKNCPLQFRFNYVIPLQDIPSNSNLVVIQRSHTEEPLVVNTLFYTNTLYTLNTEDRTLFTKLGSSTLTYTGFKEFEETLLLYKGIFNDEVNKVTNLYLGNAFMIDDNLLVCKNTTGAIAESKAFSINGWGDDAASAIYPINRDEVLLSMGRIG